MSIDHTLHFNAFLVTRRNYMAAVAFELSHNAKNLNGFAEAMRQADEAKQACDLTSGAWI
jgi:hypothetical protein